MISSDVIFNEMKAWEWNKEVHVLARFDEAKDTSKDEQGMSVPLSSTGTPPTSPSPLPPSSPIFEVSSRSL